MSADFCSVDIETFSTSDLRKCGSFRYFENPLTDVWCLCYAFGDEPVSTWFPGDPLPARFLAHAAAGGLFRGWNSSGFERLAFQTVLSKKYGWPVIPNRQWHDTMAYAAVLGLPRSLDGVARALRVSSQKDKVGHALMLRMCRPRAVADDGTLTWWREPDKIQRLAAYCGVDVETERAIAKRLRPLTAAEHEVYVLDMRINSRGCRLDTDLIAASQKIVAAATVKLDAEMHATTKGAVPKCTNVAKLSAWLTGRGVELPTVLKENDDGENEARPTLAKAAMRELLARDDLPDDCKKAIEIRAEAALSSTAKLTAMQNAVCADGRLRGMYLFAGTGPGRWTGKLVQPTNLPRGTVPDVNSAAPYVLTGNADLVDALWAPPLAVVSSMLRGMFIPDHGKRLIVVDYSSIQARITAWVAGEHWKLDAFRAYDARTGPDLYKLAASRIYRCGVDAVSKSQRQIGKVSELACSFGGGVNAFQAMAALYNVKIPNEEADEIKMAWREANPAIAALWRDLENAAFDACRRPGIVTHAAKGKIRFSVRGSWLFLILPSGRAIAYAFPSIKDRTLPWGDIAPGVHFWAVEPMTRQWVEVSTYGGRLTENIAMGIERDILVGAMFRLENAGYPITLSSYDELVAEKTIGEGGVDEVVALMTCGEAWSTGLPIAAAGAELDRYAKLE